MERPEQPVAIYIPPVHPEPHAGQEQHRWSNSTSIAAVMTIAALASASVTTSHAEAPVRDEPQALATPHQKHNHRDRHEQSERRHHITVKTAGRVAIHHAREHKSVGDPKPRHYLKWMKIRDNKNCTGIDSGYSMYRMGMSCKGDRANVLYDTPDPDTGKIVSQFGEVHHHGRVLCGAFRPGVLKTRHVDPAKHPRCNSYYLQRYRRSHFATPGRSNAAPGECVGGTRFAPRQNGQKTLYANFATAKPSPSNLYPTKTNSGFYDRVGSVSKGEQTDYRFQYKFSGSEGKAAAIVARSTGWVMVKDSGTQDFVPGVPRGNCLKKEAWMTHGSHPVSDARR